MDMITVDKLRKEFKKPVKEPGLKGSVKSLFKPKSEKVVAVRDISFEVDEGEILGFIGPNGAGKSTVIKMLTGILTPTAGSCTINGKNPTQNRKSYVREIGVVFGQRTQLWWDLPLRETYGVLKEIYEMPEDSYKKRMAFLNEVLELEEFIANPVRTLSLGQRMRADIAASLLHSPKVLFSDFAKYLATVYNRLVQNVITYIIPFALTSYYPALFILKGENPLFNLGMPVLAAVVLMGAGIAVWHRGIRAYESAGS